HHALAEDGMVLHDHDTMRARFRHPRILPRTSARRQRESRASLDGTESPEWGKTFGRTSSGRRVACARRGKTVDTESAAHYGYQLFLRRCVPGGVGLARTARRDRERGFVVLKTALIALSLLVASMPPPRVRAAVSPGMTLDQSTADQAKDLLPPEIYDHYKKGEYTNAIVDFPDSKFQWDDGYDKATEWNRQHLVLSPEKQPVDKDTGKRPDYIMGRPFPDIRQDDPDAGYKVLWNTIFTVYNGGNSRNVTNLNWVSRTGIERAAGQDVVFLYYDGQPRHYSPPTNPDNLIFQFLALTLNPADLQGTAALSWRYKDPGKRDASWAYVPALRRVRSVSPTNRSDGFLGSDLSQDDGNFF